MRKGIYIALAILCINACGNAGQTSKPKCTTTLDEVEFFYLDIKDKLIHVDQGCTENACRYVQKAEIFRYNDILCTKCISQELAKEIFERQYSLE